MDADLEKFQTVRARLVELQLERGRQIGADASPPDIERLSWEDVTALARAIVQGSGEDCADWSEEEIRSEALAMVEADLGSNNQDNNIV